MSHVGIGLVRTVGYREMRGKFGIDGREIHQATSRRRALSRAIRGRISPRTSVSLSVIVQTQPARDHGKPRRESTPPVVLKAPQAAIVVLLQPLQHERIGVHRSVMLAKKVSRDMQEQATVHRYELSPRSLARGAFRSHEQGFQSGRHVVGKGKRGGPETTATTVLRTRRSVLILESQIPEF